MDNLTIIFFLSRSGFSQLASQGSWGSKNVTVKGNSPGLLSRQKSGSGKPAERSLWSTPAPSQSLLKLKKDAMTKNSGTDIFLFFLLNIVNSNFHLLGNSIGFSLSMYNSTPSDWSIDGSLNTKLLFSFFSQKPRISEFGVRMNVSGLLGQQVFAVSDLFSMLCFDGLIVI